MTPGVDCGAIRLMNRVARSPFLTKNLLPNDGVSTPSVAWSTWRAVSSVAGLRSILRRAERGLRARGL